MERVGDELAGFSVDVDHAANEVRVKGWGFWTTSIATAFRTVVPDACRHRPKGASLAFDMTALRPMRDEGQQAFSVVMSALSRFGITEATVSTTSQLTRLQLMRIVNEHKSPIRFT